MNEHELVERIKALEKKLDLMSEIIEQMPPTISEAIALHERWLRKEKGGVRLSLAGANLRSVNLDGADLTRNDFTRSNIKGASFLASQLKQIRKVIVQPRATKPKETKIRVR